MPPPLLHIVPIYASILAFIYTYLTWCVIKQRRKARVAIGDGGKPALTRAIAVHNNFAQYVPYALLLIAFTELNHAPNYLVQGLCVTLLVSRSLHAYGVSQEKENLKFRKISIIMTFSVIACASLFLLTQSL